MDWLLIAAGGALGALSRYWVGTAIHDLSKAAGFPLGTVVINLVGCLLIGLYFGFHDKGLPEQLRLLIVVGFLGGFTTFSTFGFETFELIRGGSINLALLNVFLQCSFGVALVWIGNIFAKVIWP